MSIISSGVYSLEIEFGTANISNLLVCVSPLSFSWPVRQNFCLWIISRFFVTCLANSRWMQEERAAKDCIHSNLMPHLCSFNEGLSKRLNEYATHKSPKSKGDYCSHSSSSRLATFTKSRKFSHVFAKVRRF